MGQVILRRPAAFVGRGHFLFIESVHHIHQQLPLTLDGRHQLILVTGNPFFFSHNSTPQGVIDFPGSSFSFSAFLRRIQASPRTSVVFFPSTFTYAPSLSRITGLSWKK